MEGLRRRLTLWYVGVFALILAGFGATVYAIVAWKVAASLDRSLMATADAAGHLVTRGAGDTGALVKMLEPDRRVRVLWEGEAGVARSPDEAWVDEALGRALREGALSVRHESDDDQTWHLYARRVTGSGGRHLAVAAWAPAVEIEDAYPGLLVAFLAAGVASLALVAVGGWRLAHRSLAPLEGAFGEMRRFMADAAHELRTPLAVVRSLSDVALQRERSTGEYRSVLADVGHEAGRMGDIVERLLLLARADAGDWPTVTELLFLDDVVLEVAHAGGALGVPRNVRVEVGEVAEAPVVGDAGLLRQLLLALVDNAVKYSPEGGVVRLSVAVSANVCSAHVDDDGPGIHPEARERIFERFYREDSARGRKGGAGLGLAIAAWIAELHGGAVRLDTGREPGTRFTLTLPRTPASSG